MPIRSQINAPLEKGQIALRTLSSFAVSPLPHLDAAWPKETKQLIKRLQQCQSHGTKPSGRSAQASPFTTVEENESPKREGYFPKPHREVTVGLWLAAPTSPRVLSGRAWEWYQRKTQSKDAFLGSTGMFQGLHEANEIVCKTVWLPFFRGAGLLLLSV